MKELIMYNEIVNDIYKLLKEYIVNVDSMETPEDKYWARFVRDEKALEEKYHKDEFVVALLAAVAAELVRIENERRANENIKQNG